MIKYLHINRYTNIHKQIYRHKWRYLKSFFNIVDLLIVALLITCLILNVYRTILVNSLILQRGTYANDIDMYTNKVTTKAGGGANDYQSNVINTSTVITFNDIDFDEHAKHISS